MKTSSEILYFEGQDMALPGKTEQYVDFLTEQLDLKVHERPELGHWSGLGTAIGALCLRFGIMDVDQLDHLLETQENEGGLFGEIGIRLGYLSEEIVNQLLEIQELNRRMELTEMLYLQGTVNLKESLSYLSDGLDLPQVENTYSI